MKFVSRVMLSVAGPTAALLLVCAGVVVGAGLVDEGLTRYFANEDALHDAATEMYAQGLQKGQALRNVVLDPSNRKAYENLEAAAKAFDEALNSARAAATATDTVLLQEIANLAQAHQAVQAEVLQRSAADQAEAVRLLTAQETPKWRELRGKLLALKKHAAEEKIEARQGLARFLGSARAAVIALALACLAGCSWAAWSLRQRLRNELGGDPSEARDVLARVESGDLLVLVPVRAGDSASLMASIDRMQKALRNLVGDINRVTNSMGTATGEIASGNADLSARTERQASSLQETAASMEQLSGTVQNNAESAQQASGLSDRANEIVQQGGQAVQNVVHTMSMISQHSHKISEITSVIDGIAFQTNILALNAAVEAARAGEQGRGFAVVAAEVRSLAHRSAEAAKEIKGLIGENVAKVEQGAGQVGSAGETMRAVVTQIAQVSALIREIASATSAQGQGLREISQAVATLDDATQQNAALVEQSSAAAESLNQQARLLTQLVSRFKV